GLTPECTQLVDGGALSEGGPARRSLASCEAVAYHFTIAEAGDYRVRSFGAGTTFRCRLEDDAGWPVEPPNVTADLTRHFEPGTYRIVSLPEPVATRRVTLFERVRQAAKREGHGPHALGLAERVEHVWTEPEQLVAGLDREVSAPGTVPLSVGRDGLVQLASFGSADVRARVYDAADHLVAENDDGADDWNFQIQARLAAGPYRLHVEPVGR